MSTKNSRFNPFSEDFPKKVTKNNKIIKTQADGIDKQKHFSRLEVS